MDGKTARCIYKLHGGNVVYAFFSDATNAARERADSEQRDCHILACHVKPGSPMDPYELTDDHIADVRHSLTIKPTDEALARCGPMSPLPSGDQLPKRICAYNNCGMPFPAQDPRKKFCSRRCTNLASRQARNQEKHIEKIASRGLANA